MRLDDPVVIAKVSHPIPFRTRTLNPLAPMVLCLKTRESRSLPDLLTALYKPSFLSVNTAPSSRFRLYDGVPFYDNDKVP